MDKIDLKRGVDFIGVSVPFVVHDGKGKILMQKRSKKCRDEQGRWDIGSGAVEFGETLEDAVRREIKEELGADVLEIEQLVVFSAHRQNNGKPTHWVAIGHAAKVNPKQVVNSDRDKIDELGWFNIKDMPTPRHSQISRTLHVAVAKGIVK